MKYISLFGFYMLFVSFVFDFQMGKSRFSDLMAASGATMVVASAAVQTLKNRKV
jgi:hypothetical protein